MTTGTAPSASPTAPAPAGPGSTAASLAVGPGVRSAAVVGGLASACGIALTATAGWLIVAASHRPVILTLLAVIVAVRTFGIARPVLRYLERVRSHDGALDLLARRRVTTYRALVPLTPARLGRRARSDVLTAAVADLEDLVYAQVRVVVPVLGAAVAGALAVLVLALVVPLGALVLAAVLVAHAAVAALGRRLETDTQRVWLAARARVAGATTLATGYAGQLAAIGAGPTVVGWVEQAQDELRRATRRLSTARAVTVGLGHLVTGLGTVAAAYAASRASAWGLTDTVAAVLVLSPLAVGDALVGLPDAMSAWARARGSRSRLLDLLDQPPAVAASAPPDVAEPDVTPPILAGPDGGGATPGTATVPRIELRGVSARWWPDAPDGATTRPDLPPSTLTIEPGQHLVLVGANGAGKSTLLAVLARALDPAQGQYLLDGRDVTALGLEQVRAILAIVEDDPHVFATSLRENVRLARPGASDEAIAEALAAAGLSAWSAGLAQGLDTMLGAGGRGVSGGERARLALARAHLSGRPVVLLDEPVAHLDHATALAVLADIRAGFSGRTVVLVSHRPDGVDSFDRVVDVSDLAAP